MSNALIREKIVEGDQVTLENYDTTGDFNLFTVLTVDTEEDKIEVSPPEDSEITFEDGSIWVGLASISGLYPSKIVVLKHE